MDGYDVVTSDGERLGHVVGVAGDNLIVEHGTLRKSRHALPNVFAHVHDDEQVVRTTLSKQLIEDSPKIGDNGDLDESAVAAYYGLAGGEREAPSEGYGELNPDDPALTADQQGSRADVMPAEQQRAEMRNNLEAGTTYGPAGRPIIPPDPHTSSRPGDYDKDR
jgi:hypothetical protein